MIEGESILAIIPARGGSKGLPRKNVKSLNGNPLISWTIKQAQESQYIDSIFVSSEDEEICQAAQACGVKIPFQRPQKLAQDNSKTCDVVMHVIEALSKIGKTYDFILLLEPTSPLRKKGDIDNAIKKLASTPDSHSLVSVGEIHTEYPEIVKKVNEYNFLEPYTPNLREVHQRQMARVSYFPYGVAYMSRVPSFINNMTFYTEKTIPFFIERWQNYEIDDLLDFIIVEKILQIKMEEIHG